MEGVGKSNITLKTAKTKAAPNWSITSKFSTIKKAPRNMAIIPEKTLPEATNIVLYIIYLTINPDYRD